MTVSPMARLKHPLAHDLHLRALFCWRVYLKRVVMRGLAVGCMALSLSILAGSVAMMLYSVTQDMEHPLKLSPLYSMLHWAGPPPPLPLPPIAPAPHRPSDWKRTRLSINQQTQTPVCGWGVGGGGGRLVVLDGDAGAVPDAVLRLLLHLHALPDKNLLLH